MTTLTLAVDIHVVLRALAAGRDLATGSGPWTTRFVNTANAQFSGRWREVELDSATLASLWLPPHAGEPCQGDRRAALAPQGGASVANTVRRLRESSENYAGANPCCWGRIAAAMDAPLSPIIVTTQPLDEDEYRSIDIHHDRRVYHLDGLHRLIGWSLAGRLTPAVRVRAFLAG